MDADTDLALLRSRVVYLEGILWSLGKLLTGVKVPNGSTGPGTPPTSADMDTALAAFGSALSGRSGTGCPPWCNIDNTALNRPVDWPTY
ncbi:MAG TPA: hypothetical protein PLF26_19555 [Blastocatellia bacterium]|nr:hypothetical protein [Blastocatellia bacterium]